MNEQIKKLARECFDVANDGNEDKYLGTTAGVEKFAKLVILECARVVKASSPNGMIGVNAIRIHFGLEP